LWTKENLLCKKYTALINDEKMAINTCGLFFGYQETVAENSILAVLTKEK
jgi:hypothetical protein